MAATINTFTNGTNSISYSWGPGNTQNPQAQSFYTPNSSDIILDKITTRAERNGLTGSFTYTAYISEIINGTPSEASITSKSGIVALSSSAETLFDIDFPDVTLDPLKQYAIVLTKDSGNGNITLSPYNNDPYSRGNFYMKNNNSWTPFASADLAFIAYFISPPQQGFVALSTPSGNFNEATGIAISLSGSYSGTGTFAISNADQTGNTSLKVGKYGSLTVDALTGAFQYTPDQTKIKPLKTGETGVDEFTITLTAVNGTVTSSTYRVDIIGDTGSDNGGGGDDKPKSKTISITGSRGTVSGKPGILVDGSTENFDAGSKVIPYVRFPGGEYSQGAARPTVDANGDFSWQRKTGKKAYVYFTSEDGSVTSNRVIIPSGGAALASSSLKAFDSDPIVGGSSNQHAGHKKGKRRRPVAPAASFGNRLSEDTNSSLLIATDSADAGFYKQHDLVAASSENW